MSASIVTFPAAVVAPARVTPSAAFSPNAPSPLVTPVNVSPPADVSVFPAPIVNRSFAFVTLLVFGLKESDPTVVVMFESTRIPSIARTVSALKLLSPASNRTCADPSPFTGPTASIVHDAIPLIPEPASTPANVMLPPAATPVIAPPIVTRFAVIRPISPLSRVQSPLAVPTPCVRPLWVCSRTSPLAFDNPPRRSMSAA